MANNTTAKIRAADAHRALETPSGKEARDENFPVGSFLIAPALRPHIATYYAFARAIDDIADNPALTPEDKIIRLEAFAEALATGRGDGPGMEKAERLARSMTETAVPRRHGTDLVIAFKQDAVNTRYSHWDDLMDYCNNSAAPVGRYLLALHGEAEPLWPASDALCNALQVINHLQDCADDYRDLDRVYIPEDWLAEEGIGIEALAAPAAPPALRRVIDRMLDRTEALIVTARTLPSALMSARLAMESAVIIAIAEALTARLRNHDPLAGRIKLGKAALLWAGITGIMRGLASRFRRGL